MITFNVRSFVVATRQTNSERAVLRSYRNARAADVLFDECRIWEACRATSAAPTYFDPIQIGRHSQKFVDGGVLYNNPVQLLYHEASDIWPARRAVIVSVGTGSPPNKTFNGNIKNVIEAMKALVTETDRTTRDFQETHRDLVDDGLFFRFTVGNKLGHIGLEEYKEIAAIADATQGYLDEPDTKLKMRKCLVQTGDSVISGKCRLCIRFDNTD